MRGSRSLQRLSNQRPHDYESRDLVFRLPRHTKTYLDLTGCSLSSETLTLPLGSCQFG